MAKGLYDWSATAADNDDADATIDWAEGMLAPNVNNSARAEMARVAAFRQLISGEITTTGSANAYLFANPTGHTWSAYPSRFTISFKANFTNSGPATLNVDGIGALDLKKFGTQALASGDIVSGNIYTAYYDGTNLQVGGALGANPSYQPLDATLTAFAALTIAAGTVIYGTGSDAFAVLAAGTATYFLQSNNTSAPAWALGNIPGKQSVWIPAAAMISRTTNGAAAGSSESTTNKIMQATLDFDPTTNEFAQFTFALPKSYNNSTVTFEALWTGAAAGDVIWGLQGVALSDDDAIDTAFGTAQEVTDTRIATDILRTSESSAITIAGTPAAGDLVWFQVYRNAASASDTMTGADAKLLGIRLFFTTNAANDA